MPPGANHRSRKIILAEPRGFLRRVSIAPSKRFAVPCAHLGGPLYVRHQIVHNRFVLEALEKEGAVFVETLDEVSCRAAGHFQRSWRRAQRVGSRQRSRFARYRCDLPAGHQGAPGSPALRERRPDRRARRSRRP